MHFNVTMIFEARASRSRKFKKVFFITKIVSSEQSRKMCSLDREKPLASHLFAICVTISYCPWTKVLVYRQLAIILSSRLKMSLCQGNRSSGLKKALQNSADDVGGRS